MVAKYEERRWYRSPSSPSPISKSSLLSVRNFNPMDKPAFYRSIELVRNTSVLCDFVKDDGGNVGTKGDGSVFDQKAPFTHNMQKAYEYRLSVKKAKPS